MVTIRTHFKEDTVGLRYIGHQHQSYDVQVNWCQNRRYVICDELGQLKMFIIWDIFALFLFEIFFNLHLKASWISFFTKSNKFVMHNRNNRTKIMQKYLLATPTTKPNMRFYSRIDVFLFQASPMICVNNYLLEGWDAPFSGVPS